MQTDIENVRIDPSWIVNVLSCLKTWIISCFSDNWKSNFSHLKAITKAALTLSKPKKLSVAQHGKTSRDNSSFLLFLRISYSEFPKKNSQNPFPLSFYIFLIHWNLFEYFGQKVFLSSQTPLPHVSAGPRWNIWPKMSGIFLKCKISQIFEIYIFF